MCEHIQSQICSRRPPSSPRASRKFTTDLSESSSCGSDTSDRLSPYPATRVSRYVCMYFSVFMHVLILLYSTYRVLSK